MRFFVFLFSLFLFCPSSIQAAPASQAPRAGEIALEGTIKPLATRLVAWSENAPLDDPLTPLEKAPFLPAPQTQGNVTFRIIDAGFASLAQLFPRSEKSMRPLFYFSYTLPGAPNAQIDKSGWETSAAQRNTRLLQVSGPNGEPVALASALVPLPRDAGVYRGTQVAFNGVNPAWKNVIAEFEILDPKAPPDASGESNSVLSFETVPVPAKTEREIEVGKAVTTARGTKIVLQSLRADKPSDGEKGSSYFVFAVTPPANVPDMRVVLGMNGVKNQDGKPWQFTSWGSGGLQGGGIQLHVEAAPRQSDTSLTLGIKIEESAPSLQKRQWYRRFRVEIPVAALWKIGPSPLHPKAPVWKAEGESVALEVEPDSHRLEGNWDALVWIKSRVPDADKTQRWLLRAVKARAAGKGMGGWTYDRNYDRQFMRLNGTVAAPDEHSNSIVLPFFGAWPATFDLEFKLDRARRLESFSQLRGVPLPAPGASLDIREGQFKNDTLRVRRLFWFKNASELVGLPPRARANFQNANLAVVVEILPVFPGAALEIPAYRVQDDAGRSLSARRSFDALQWGPRGDAGRAGTENTNLRTLILPVSTSSKSLDLWLNTVEIVWSGQSETLILKDVTGK